MFARLLAVFALALLLGAGSALAHGHHSQFCNTAATACATGCTASHTHVAACAAGCDTAHTHVTAACCSGHLHGSACHAGQHTHWCKKCSRHAREWTNHGGGNGSGHKQHCSGHRVKCSSDRCSRSTWCDKCANKTACATCGKAGCTSCPTNAAVCATCGKEGCTSCPVKTSSWTHGCGKQACGHRHATHCGQNTWCSSAHSCGKATWCKHANCTHLCANHCAGHGALADHRPCTGDGLSPELRQKVEELRRIHNTGA